MMVKAEFGDLKFMSDKPKIDATCTWGDGPDILIEVNVKLDAINSFDMSLKEAQQFVGKLLSEISKAEELERLSEGLTEKD